MLIIEHFMLTWCKISLCDLLFHTSHLKWTKIFPPNRKDANQRRPNRESNFGPV